MISLSDERDKGDHEQPDADEQERVAVALEVSGPPDDEQGRDEADDAECGPGQLIARESVGSCFGLVDTDDEHVPDAVEQHRQWEQDAVCVRGQFANRDVCAHEQAEQQSEEGADVGGDLGISSETGEGVRARGDDHRQDEQAEFGRSAKAAHQGVEVVGEPAGVGASGGSGSSTSVVDVVGLGSESKLPGWLTTGVLSGVTNWRLPM